MDEVGERRKDLYLTVTMIKDCFGLHPISSLYPPDLPVLLTNAMPHYFPDALKRITCSCPGNISVFVVKMIRAYIIEYI